MFCSRIHGIDESPSFFIRHLHRSGGSTRSGVGQDPARLIAQTCPVCYHRTAWEAIRIENTQNRLLQQRRAAPFAAWLVSRVSPALLGTAVGGVIVLTNSQKLVHFFGIDWPWSSVIYGVIVVVWASLVFYAWRVSRAPRYAPEPGADAAATAGDTDSESVTR